MFLTTKHSNHQLHEHHLVRRIVCVWGGKGGGRTQDYKGLAVNNNSNNLYLNCKIPPVTQNCY